MAEVAPAPAAAAPAKAPKKKAAAKPKKAGPSVGELIVKAVTASKERSGVSLARSRRRWRQAATTWRRTTPAGQDRSQEPRHQGHPGPDQGHRCIRLLQAQQESRRGEEARQESRSPQSKEGGRQEARSAKKPKKVAAKKAVAAERSPKKAKKPATPKKVAKSPKKVKKPPQRLKKAAKSPKKANKAAKPQSRQAQGSQGQEGSPQEEVNLLQTVFYSTRCTTKGSFKSHPPISIESALISIYYLS
ncbi:histone H1-like [Coregonus clupeaformis]|uniref:histone H1-like n=1 Tax=Coregonus clupeaformis TaxID=59861 RepID=UPI001E1C8581|nr:histone H1-like [Coregonus clupeaformis]